MRKITLPSTAILGVMLALSLPMAPAQAQTRTWVASNGTGSCPRTAPCLTFSFAHGVTAAGGVINCVDPGDYGQVVINKAISIVCDNTHAGIVATTSGITVGADVNDVVTLQGLDIEGNGTGLQGIDFTAGAALNVHKVRIRNFRSSNPFTAGILFQRTGSAYGELYVADSTITDNGGPGASSGGTVMFLQDTTAGNATIDRVQLENNAVGVFIDVTNGAGAGINAILRDSEVTGSASHGVTTATAAGKTPISIVVDGTLLAGNFPSGINANGVAAGSAIVRVGDSTIVNNVAGVSVSGAGVVQSFKDNVISGNLTDGTPIPAYPGPGGTALQ